VVEASVVESVEAAGGGVVAGFVAGAVPITDSHGAERALTAGLNK